MQVGQRTTMTDMRGGQVGNEAEGGIGEVSKYAAKREKERYLNQLTMKMGWDVFV